MRPSFKAAILWIADNDDTDWVVESPQMPSVTACLVADMFGKTDSEVLAALFKATRPAERAKRRDANNTEAFAPVVAAVEERIQNAASGVNDG